MLSNSHLPHQSPTAPTPSSTISSNIGFEVLGKLIEGELPRIQTIKNKKIILVMGNTKSGKSTLINYLLGAQFKESEQEDGSSVAQVIEGHIEKAKIGTSLTSETLSPEAYEDEKGVFYCDTPGFDDNRTRAEHMCSIGCTQMGIEIAEAIQGIMVLVDLQDFYTSTAEGLRRIATHLSKLINFSDPAAATLLSSRLIFVFTKNPDQKYTEKGILARVNKLITARTTVLDKQKEIINSLKNQPDAAETAQKDMINILSELSILQFISKSTQRQVINVFDKGESRAQLQGMLSPLTTHNALPKTLFTVARYSPEWDKCKEALFALAGEGKKWLEYRMDLTTNLYYKKREQTQGEKRQRYLAKLAIEFTAKQKTEEQVRNIIKLEGQRLKQELRFHIEKLNKDKKKIEQQLTNINTDNPISYLVKKALLEDYGSIGTLGAIAAVIAGSGVAIGGSQAVGAISAAIGISVASITGIAVPVIILAFISTTVGIVASTSHLEHTSKNTEIKYHDIPYLYYVEECSKPGALSRQEAACNPSKGQYSALLKRDEQTNTVSASVTFFVRQKDLPDNVILIKSYQETIKTLENKIADAEKKRTAIKRYDFTLSATELLELEITRLQRRLSEFPDKINKLERKITEVHDTLTQKISLWTTVVHLSQMLNHFGSADLMPAFCDTYAKYKRLTSNTENDSLLLFSPFYIPPHQIKWQEVIGIGGFGIVYRGEWHQVDGTKKSVAIKEARYLTPMNMQEWIEEAHTMAQLRHSNVVSFYGMALEDSGNTLKYGLVLEYLWRSLFDLLNDKKFSLSWKLRIDIAQQVSEGLAYLHKNTLIHRDIKSLNILLSSPPHYTAKLADFGSTRLASQIAGSRVGTPLWVSPELEGFGDATFSSDMFALGMVLAEMANRSSLLEFITQWNNEANTNRHAFNKKIQQQKIPFSDPDTPGAFKALALECVSYESEKRPEAPLCAQRLAALAATIT